MKEIWLPIKDHELEYEVSNFGRVRSVAGVVTYKDGRKRNRIGCILKPSIGTTGYYIVNIGRGNTKKIHKLVVNAFIPNPENKRCTNHKDGNKLNNRIDNLERATHSENNQHAYDIGLKVGAFLGKLGKDNPSSKPVSQFTMDMDFVASFGGQCEATRITGISQATISAALSGRLKHAGGYIWR